VRLNEIVLRLSLKVETVQIIRMISEENLSESSHPGWFYEALIEDSFPWSDGVAMSFEEFDQKYTLHDSYWIGAFLNIAYEPTATLAIVWDAVWLPDEIKESTPVVHDWPYLLIQLSDVEQFSPGQYEDAMGACRTISGHEVVEVDGKKILAIEDVYGSQIHIVYRGKEVFLALEKDKHRLEI
jgi:hypothetical protein